MKKWVILDNLPRSSCKRNNISDTNYD